ncbi:cell division protein FtsQ/DivIB [Companilactobacillus baiquanensis]|uniref:Cell division protein DivIB n=1 Tax=Companilactobacillus baiquanensis TaxID=2486005 RepID=A0ABW1UUN7_9LACO|nr:cell division protein FtsQ/DivIB [Companilactobacillus baiquanensis]
MAKKRKNVGKNSIILILAVVIIFIAYLGSPLSKVRNITVEGVNDLGAQQVIDATAINNNSLLVNVLLDHQSIANKTKKKLPSIETVSFKSNNLRDVVIKVREFPTLGLIYKDGYYYRVINGGHIINQKMHSPIGNYPIYSGFKTKKSLKKISKIYKKLPDNVRTNVSQFYNSPTKLNPYRIKIDMNDGNKVVADIRTVEAKMKYYPGIAAQMKQKGVINLEIGAYSYPFKAKK